MTYMKIHQLPLHHVYYRYRCQYSCGQIHSMQFSGKVDTQLSSSYREGTKQAI